MSKRVKTLISQDLERRFGDVSEAVMIDFTGLSAEETRLFRTHLRESGVSVSVVKNTLIRRVFDSRGLEFDGAFSGPTAILHGGEDAVTTSKSAAEWAKKNGKKLEFKAGLLDGKPLGEAEAQNLSKMPGKQEVRGMVVSAIAGPLTSTVGVLSNTLSSIPRVIQAIADKQKESE